MHLDCVEIVHRLFPTKEHYPFSLPIFLQTSSLVLSSPVTFLMGENGSGKSTLLRAVAQHSRIHMWQGMERTRHAYNMYEDKLHRALALRWANGPVPGSYFSSQNFQEFAKLLDQWAANDPGLLELFGGQSLMTQSHGQVLMAFFQSRYQRKGIYLLDEPETALSPKSQLALLKLLAKTTQQDQAQFLIATHSPLLLACPGAEILSFDQVPIRAIAYEDTEYYRFYRDFLTDRDAFLKDLE
ncbi:AAA family ATPase [Planctomycetota bacterium]